MPLVIILLVTGSITYLHFDGDSAKAEAALKEKATLVKEQTVGFVEDAYTQETDTANHDNYND